MAINNRGVFSTTESIRNRGEFDCLMGVPAKENQPDAYYTGYNQQYQKEQCQTHQSQQSEKGNETDEPNR